jgi:hypothetical protein
LESLKRRSNLEDLGIDSKIKKDLRETGCDEVHWVHQVLVNTAMKFRVPQNVGNFLTS